VGECLDLHTRGALATGITTLLVGTVEILHIGQSHLQGAPTTLTHKELSVAHSAAVDIVAQPAEELFVPYDITKFHSFPKFAKVLTYKYTIENRELKIGS
jgi:hypothetical protein